MANRNNFSPVYQFQASWRTNDSVSQLYYTPPPELPQTSDSGKSSSSIRRKKRTKPKPHTFSLSLSSVDKNSFSVSGQYICPNVNDMVLVGRPSLVKRYIFYIYIYIHICCNNHHHYFMN